MDFNESPVNYDFFGGQQQINDQHPGMLQSLPRQQSGISDMQLLQQQLMLKQMQEMQRQQQLQKQQEARKMNSINQVSAFAKQAAATPSQALINGIPIRETSNYSWQPELMAANTTWQQRGLSPVMQGSFRGHVFSPEQGQGMPRLMGMVPQQVDQSLYGVPISAARVTQSQYSSVPMDKPSMQQILGSSNSLTSNQYTGFPEQVSMQDGPLVSRQGYQGKNMIASSDGQGINTGFNLESLQQMNPQKSNGPVQEICTRQDLAGPSETSQEDTALQVAPSQNVATLDPTEAQILFGPDDNLWDAFGRGANTGSGGYNMSDGTDLFSSLPSVQSGSWSALMQSAVAETSSGDTGLQEEWSCLNFRNSEPPAENQQTPSVIVSTKQQSNWADNCLQSSSSLKPRPSRLSHEINTGSSYNNIPGVQQSGVNTSHEHRERLQSVSPRRHIQQFPEDGHKWSDRSLMQKAAFEGSHFHGKATHSSDAGSNTKGVPGSWTNQRSMPSYSSNDQPLNSPSGWNFMDSIPPSTTAALKNQENENSFQDSHNVDKEVPIFEVMGHGAGTWKTNSISELEHSKSAIGNPQVIPLASPSQQLLIRERAFPSQSPSQVIGSLSSNQVISNTGEKGHTLLSRTSSVLSLPFSCDTSHGHLRNSISGNSVHAGSSAPGKFSAAFSPGFPYSKNHLPNLDMPDTGGQTTACESVNESFDRFSSQPKQTDESFERGQSNQSAQPSVPDTSRHTSHDDFSSSAEMPQPNNDNQNHARNFAQQFPVLEAAPAPQHCSSSHDSASSKIQPPVWTSVPKQLRPFGAQPFQTPSDMFKPNLQSHKCSGITFSQPQKLEDQTMQTGGNSQAESDECSMNSHGYVGKEQPAKEDHLQQVPPENNWAQKTKCASHENESAVNHLTEPASNLTSTQKQIEAFGRFLKPNNILHQSYSLLHQRQGMRNEEADHANRSLKRFKSPGGSVNAHLLATQGSQQIYEHNNMARDASANHTSFPPGDSKMLSLSEKTADNQDINAPSKDMLAFGRNDFQNFANSNSAVSVRDEHSQMSNQMGPSWFDHYGIFKNEQILPMHDAFKDVAMKASELPFIAGRPDSLHAHSSLEQGNVAAANQFGIFQKSSISSPIAYENFSQSLQPDSADGNVVVMRSKKRKSTISKLVPWHKEVTLGSQRSQNLSAAEVEWALAVNRLTEKVEDELEMVDDGLPVHRSKRRLLLTTQLMQILLHPPLALILSADAILHYETAAYFVARSTLGDACSTFSCTGSDAPVPSNSGDLLPEKIKSSEKISDQYFSKVMEDLISRTRKLENDLLRLEKRASVSNLRVECQDLERFSVINRFAKFHGRDRTDGTESSSASDAAANAHKSCLQRYVTALPMPRNLPDRVQCLSL
ncbi:hypothetical protein NC653_029257 [Populus alba x Populus x berolinensis]|uniref:Dentin sialophosphoprotein-like protein n=2 Tax=Populus alba x Populus x berolinensis TaxID=444605 RepID=A0AAD6M1W0_9ROSI|nr:hypothetical protein NC653_029257 [Populus alba x Populus x berolinensis]